MMVMHLAWTAWRSRNTQPHFSSVGEGTGFDDSMPGGRFRGESFPEFLLAHPPLALLAEPARGSQVECQMDSATLGGNCVIDQKKLGALVLNAAVAAGVIVPPEDREPISGHPEGGPDGLQVHAKWSCHPRDPQKT